MKSPTHYLATTELGPPGRNAANRPRELNTKGVKPARHETGHVSRRRCGPAKIIAPAEVKKVLAYIAETSNVPEADRLKFLLSIYAGLRACEIAALRVADVTDASGRVATQIQIRSDSAKNGRARTVPMHPDVSRAISAFRSALPDIDQFAITRRFYTPRVQSTPALTVWFHCIYKKAGLKGCSSHSGRRTFITDLARAANNYNMSLRDVQVLAGHARLDTTQRYIELSENLADLVNSLGKEPRRTRKGTGK